MKKVISISLLVIFELTQFPVTILYAQTQSPRQETATDSAGLVDVPTTTQLKSMDPALAEVVRETKKPIISFDIQNAVESAMLRQKMRLRNLLKKDFTSQEQVIAIVDNAGTENMTVSINNGLGKKVDFTVREIVFGEYRIFKILAPARLQPGKYTMEVVGDSGERFTQDFTWGVLAVNTNKSIYKPDEKAAFSIAVLNEFGGMVCDALLQLEIQTPEKQATILSTENGKIQVNPECSVKDKIEKPDYEAMYRVGNVGKYDLTLTAQTKKGTYTIADSFSVREAMPFEVERVSATRIFPAKSYEMAMHIRANQDFSGTISEIVPESFQILEQSGVPEEKIASEAAIVADTKEEVLAAAVHRLRKPFDGDYPISLGFGEQLQDPALKKTYEQFGLEGHDGIDFEMPYKTPILAVDEGTVTLAEDADYGLTVVIQHAWGKSYYGHLSKITTPLGTPVTTGQPIGLSGDSGLSTGTHLHFGIKQNDAEKDNGYFGKINPEAYLGLTEKKENRDYAVKFLKWPVQLKKGQSLELLYAYDAPDQSPEFYTVGPLAFHENGNITFQEERQWQIAVDATTHMLLFWDPANGSAPTGWSIVTTYDGRFIRGESVANVLTTGGNATHTPTTSGSVTANTGTSGRLGGGSNTISSFGHTHTSSVTIGAANNLPAFRSMQLMQYDAGIPSTIPANAIALFDASPGMPGSGWTRISAQDTNMIRINSSVATGGSDTHTHSLTWGALAAASGQITTGANTNNQGATTTHTHTAPAATNSDSQTSLPAYVHAVVASATSNTLPPTGMIALFDGAPSGSYSIQSDSGGAYYQRFVRGNTAGNAGTTGGAATHSHGSATSGVSGAASATARGTATAGSVAAGNGHTHTLAASFTAGDNHTPQYVNVVIAEKIDAPELTQIHSRWRNDDGSETTATWRRSEDISATADVGVSRRLRIEVSNEGTLTSGSITYRLEYGLKSTTCDAIASWTAVTASAPGGSDMFEMHNSSNLTDGNATTNVAGGLTDENTTFVAGVVKDTGNQTTGITLSTTQFTEIEYSIKPTSNTSATQVYCFRLTNAGSTTNFIYTLYPELTVGDPNLDQKHYRWRNDDGAETTVTNQTVSLLPTGQGSATGWNATIGCTNDTAEWDCVNDNGTADSTNDGSGSFLVTTTVGARSSFSLNNSSVPVGATVSQLQIFMLGAEQNATGGDATVTAYYTIGAGNVDCSSASAFGGTLYTGQSCTFSGLSLSATDIDNMEIGILFGSNDPLITKVYVTVTYSRSAATWKQNENTAHTNQAKSTNIRLRLSLANTGNVPANRNFRLEYAAKSGGSCGDNETFTTMPVTAASEHFEMTSSTQFTDGDATTTQLTATGLGTFSAGKMIEDPSNASGTFVSTNGQYTEMEYNFEAKTTASGNYCFRVTDNGTVLDTYTVYPELSIVTSGPTLEQTMRHGKWFSSGTKQPFTF